MRLLIEGCKNQDRESQRLLFRHYYAFAYSVCVRYSGSVQEAKEVLNDGFLKVFKKIDLYDTNRSFEGWFRRILINTAIDHMRANKKHKNDVSIDQVEQGYDMEIFSQMSYLEVLKLVQKLSPMYRTVFSLYVIDGYSHEEIADRLEISVGTSKSNLFKARRNLKEMLRKENKELYEKYV